MREAAITPSQRRLGSGLFSERAWKVVAQSLRLSRRELQIVRRILDDDTEFMIAAHLGISPHTVHTHVERLHRKLAVTDRVELLVSVMREFLKLTVSPGSTLPPICAKRAAGLCPFV